MGAHEAGDRRASPHAVAAFASMVGTTIEWYDFFLYGTAAALIFNRLFFPNFDPLVGTLAAFATYSVGFFARPLGGAIFGHFGDRVGRKSMLLITLLLMGVPTTLIGLIPSYKEIGIAAPVALVVLRMLQGVAVGGEWGGAALLAIEHAPPGRRSFYGSLPQVGVGLGLALSSLAMALTARLPDADLFGWGWRLPFLASSLLLAVGWFIRVRVGESPEFARLGHDDATLARPLVTALREHPGAILKALGARFAEATWFYTVTTFTLAYATAELHIPRPAILTVLIVAATSLAVAVPLFGAIGDRVAPKWLYAAGAVSAALLAFPYFSLIREQSTGSLYLAMIPALAICQALMYGQQGTLFASQFPAAVRYSGISFAVQVAGAVGGGLAPLVATQLLAAGGGDTRLISLTLVTTTVLGAICAATMRAGDAIQATPSRSTIHTGDTHHN
jgi:MFS family permease